MTAPRHFRIGTAFRARLFGLLSALALASTAWLTAPTPAAATPLTYTLSDVAATFYTPNLVFVGTDTFAGSFVFDPTAIPPQPYTDVAITVSGPVEPGFYPNASLSDFGQNIRITQGASPFPAFAIAFNNTLGFLPDGLGLFGFQCLRCGLHGETFNGLDITGVIIPSVSEPASLALLGGALGLLLFALGLKRRRNRA